MHMFSYPFIIIHSFRRELSTSTFKWIYPSWVDLGNTHFPTDPSFLSHLHGQRMEDETRSIGPQVPLSSRDRLLRVGLKARELPYLGLNAPIGTPTVPRDWHSSRE